MKARIIGIIKSTKGVPLGDAVAGLIEQHALSHVAVRAPSVARSLKKCGGCTQAKHALGSAEKHPDAGAVI